jgi:hypothetical protein
METKMEQFSATNTNPVLRVDKGGTVLYSNEASKPLFQEWGVVIGGKLPSYIGDLVQRVITRNSPEKMEIDVGKGVYLVVFHPLPEQECVNISGFDISDRIELEEKPRESEALEMMKLELAEYNKSQQTKDDWEQFALKFSEEMKLHVPSVAILRIAKRAQSKDVFLVGHEGLGCGERCHRFILLNLIDDVAKEKVLK